MMGLPHAIAITTADVTDRDGAIQMIFLNLDNLSHVEKFLVDGGYPDERFANQVKDICGAQVEVVKRNELHKVVGVPRRGVVERLFGGRKLALDQRLQNHLLPDDPDSKVSGNGNIILTGLDAGTYVVEEINAPNGYVMDIAPQTAYISGEEQDCITLTFTNSKYGVSGNDKMKENAEEKM